MKKDKKDKKNKSLNRLSARYMKQRSEHGQTERSSDMSGGQAKRRSRYHDYEAAQERNFRRWVHEDGSRMSEAEILSRHAFGAVKKITTR